MGLASVVAIVACGVAGLVAAAASRLIAGEIEAWLPTVTDWALQRALCALADDQERYGEEWSGYLDAIPGRLSRLIVAFDLLLRAAPGVRLAQVSALQRSAQDGLRTLAAGFERLALLEPAIRGLDETMAILQSDLVTKSCLIQNIDHAHHLAKLATAQRTLTEYHSARFALFRSLQTEINAIIQNAGKSDFNSHLGRLGELMADLKDCQLRSAMSDFQDSGTAIVDAVAATVALVTKQSARQSVRE